MYKDCEQRSFLHESAAFAQSSVLCVPSFSYGALINLLIQKDQPHHMKRPPRNRPDKDGCHKAAFLKNKKILYATQSYCAICGRPVDFSLKFPDPMSPTADHIIPIAKGGHPSALENLQLTHLGCNQRKGDKLFKQRKEPIRCSNRSLQLSADWRTL